MAVDANDRITLTLPEIGDECERRDACAEGVEWCRTHTLADVPDTMPADWAMWVVVHLPDLPREQTALFRQAAQRGEKQLAIMLCRGDLSPTPAALAALQAYLLSTPRSLALSLARLYPKAPKAVRAALARVIEAQRHQTHPGMVE